MKASPVRPGDFIEFFAEIDLLVALSACPGGDCGASHSDDTAKCYPLKVEIHRPRERALAGWQSPTPNKYSRSHSPELNPVERVWHCLRSHWLANSLFASMADIINACEIAWNRFATNHGLIRSLCAVAWAPASPAP